MSIHTLAKQLTIADVHFHIVMATGTAIAAFENLQPDTMLTLYHGTDRTHAAKFLNYGLDGTKVVSRTHNQGNERGLYVTPDKRTALSFGNIIFEFKTKAKYLFPTARWGAGSVSRKEEIAKKNALERYPKSFRPVVSIQLNDTIEPQAMLIGYIPVKNIEAVWFAKPEETKTVRYTTEEAANLLSVYKVSSWSGDETAAEVIKEMLSGRSISYEELIAIFKDEYQQGMLAQMLDQMRVPRKLILRVLAFIKKL